MKTQTTNKKYSMLLFSALASLMLMTAACQKNSGGGNQAAPIVPVVPQGCAIQPCTGIPGGGVALYSGTTTNGFYTQAQFQVSGDQSGTGLGYITGVININNYVCQVGQPNLNGQYQIQMAQQGYLQSDVFTGSVTLVGPQGSVPAFIKVVPTRTQGTGLFTVILCGYDNSSNF